MKAKGSLDLLGPSTQGAINALLAGAIRRGWSRATPTVRRCRITPSRSRVRSLDLDELVTRVALASRLTHNTSVALASAAAVAGAGECRRRGSHLRGDDRHRLRRGGSGVTTRSLDRRCGRRGAIRWAIDLVRRTRRRRVSWTCCRFWSAPSLATWSRWAGGLSPWRAPSSDEPWLAVSVAASLA